jgi:hypothetical protein
MKTSELTDNALDWAVAKCEGIYFEDLEDFEHSAPDYSDWAQGGPIIEREGLTLTHQADRWVAQTDADLFAYGPTPLIAAMRCYVASKLGDNIDIPEELIV